jgi:hypothetical protein
LLLLVPLHLPVLPVPLALEVPLLLLDPLVLLLLLVPLDRSDLLRQ